MALPPVVRSPLVLAGLLLLGVGFGEVVTGHTRIAKYREVLRDTPAPAPADPAALFPMPSESQERHEVARAKLAFYQLLTTVGRFLGALGLALVVAGVVKARLAPRPQVSPVASH